MVGETPFAICRCENWTDMVLNGGIDLVSFICFGSLGFRHGHLQAIFSSQDLLHNRSMSIYMVSQPLFVGLR